MPKITIPESPSIIDQILALPINSVIGVRAKGDPPPADLFSEVALRTGETGWLTVRPHGITDKSLLASFGGSYLNNNGMRQWLAQFGESGDFYHLTGE